MEKKIYNLEKYNKELDYQEKKLDNNNKTIYFNNIAFAFDFNLFLGGGRFYFKNCDFLKRIEVSTSRNITDELIFDNCTFLDELNLEKCKFQKNVKFWQSTFNNVNFHNTTFNGLADFWSCTFNENVIFYKTDFLGTTVFSAATFNKSVLFTYTSISKVIIFRGTRFENGLDLSQAIISGNISLHDIKIKKFKAVDNTDDNNKYENYISENGNIPYSNKRETYRILKQAYSKNGNEIDSLKYRKREHNTLFHELLSNMKLAILPLNIYNLSGIKYFKFYVGKLFSRKSKRLNRLFDLFVNIQNMIILFLNFISNYFGVSWFTGMLFISSVGSLFFLLSITEIPEYYFTLNCSKWETEHFKHFLEFLNPTHKFDYIQKENLTTKFYIFDFLGRIFVGYGIYQFIQAFRKYK